MRNVPDLAANLKPAAVACRAVRGALFILVGLALAVFGGARFLVERLNGSSPWTPAAALGLALLVAGLLLAGFGVRKVTRR